MRRINIRKRGKVYEYFFDRESFDAIKKILGKYRIYNITPYLLNQALLKLYQKNR